VTIWRLGRARDRRLLPDSRMVGAMPWVIAIMLFLTVLAAAAGFGLAQAGSQLRSGLAARVTIQIVEADAVQRERQTKAVLKELDRLAGVASYHQVDPDSLAALLRPWVGDSLGQDGIPVPAMVDVELERGASSRVAAIGEALKTIAPAARIDSHGNWLEPIEALIRALRWLSLTLVLLMAVATASMVVLAARAALDTHHDTIDVMHLLGATDGQIARLFQRRIAIDALIGGLIGFAGAALVVVVLARRIEGLGSELVGAVSLSPAAWLLLLLLPLLGTALAMATARITILKTLGRIL
jgi:cell division transport system permease protein